MKYLIVYAHPYPKSFNHAILETLTERFKKEKRAFEVRDLYEIGFAPALTGKDLIGFKEGRTAPDIAAEQSHVAGADTLIFIYPVWWFGMPAILKGYIDRVLSFGFAYTFDGKNIKGLLPGKKVAILNTTGGPEEVYTSGGFKEALGKTTDAGIFGLCGMNVILHKYFYEVPVVSADARKAMLEEIKSLNL